MGFLAALVLAGSALDEPVTGGEVADAVPVSLWAVGVPSLLVIMAARRGWARVAGTAVMTSVAAAAGAQVIASDDAQAGLAIFLVGYVGVPLALVSWLGRAVAARRWVGWSGSPPEVAVAAGARRLSALVVDILVAGAVLVVPLTVLSHADREVVAAVVGVTVGVVYLSTAMAAWGRTIGGQLLGLRVTRGVAGGWVRPVPAILRSVMLVVEVLAAVTVALVPLILADVVVMLVSGRSVADRLLGTRVVEPATSGAYLAS